MKYLLLVLGVMLSCFLICTGCSKKDTDQQNNLRQSDKAIFDKTTLLATIADDEKPQSVTPPSGPGIHAPLEAVFQLVFSRRGGGVAYCAEKNGKVYVVHNGKPGKQYTTVGTIALSPDGRRIAYGALVDGKWCMVIDGKEGEFFSTVKAPVFSPDGTHVAYQAMAGEKWYLVVDTKPNAGTRTRILDHAFSGDSAKIAYIDNADDKNIGRLVVSDLVFSKQVVMAAKVSRMIVNEDKTRLAAIRMADNKYRIVESGFDRPAAVKTGPQYDRIQHISFGLDGASVVYAAERAGKRFVVYNGKEEALPEGGGVTEPPVPCADHKGFGALIAGGNGTFLYQSDGKNHKQYEEAANLVNSWDGNSYAYAARKGNSWFVVVNDMEGPAFDRVVTPLFSPDGNYVVYRARKDGKRFVVVADRNGRTIKTLPAYEQVFEVQFSANGKSFAYGVKDGRKLIWKVEEL